MMRFLSYFVALLLTPLMAFGAIPTRIGNGLIVGQYLYHNNTTTSLEFGSTTGKWNAWLNTINGQATTSIFLPAGGTTGDYLQGGTTPAWASLNTGAVNETSNFYFTNARARAALSATAPLSYSVGGVFSIPQGSTTVDGYIAAADWVTFNNKVSTTRAINTTAPLSGGGNLSADRTLTISAASSTASGVVDTTTQSFGGEKRFESPIVIAQQSVSPSSTTGAIKLYAKNDDKLYFKKAGGTEVEIGSGGGGGGGTVGGVSFGGASENSVCSSSPCTVYRANPSTTTVTRGGTGSYTLDFGSFFTNKPICSGSTYGAGFSICRVESHPTANTVVFSHFTSGAAADGICEIVCVESE